MGPCGAEKFFRKLQKRSPEHRQTAANIEYNVVRIREFFLPFFRVHLITFLPRAKFIR